MKDDKMIVSRSCMVNEEKSAYHDTDLIGQKNAKDQLYEGGYYKSDYIRSPLFQQYGT